MNIEKLSVLLKPWMAIETWSTPHPADTARFHRALARAIEQLGPSIGFDNYSDAMRHIAEEIYPDTYNEEFIESQIERYASRAEIIETYLSDITT